MYSFQQEWQTICRVELLAVLQRSLALIHPASSLQHVLEWEICSSELGSRLANRVLLKVSAQHASAACSDALLRSARPDRTDDNDRLVLSSICLALLHVCIARYAALQHLFFQ